jgi:hypothetical protein
VRRIFTLGTPHRGFTLERLASSASSALSLLPETRALANALEARSGGMKDLHQAPRDIPFLSSAQHYFVSGGFSRTLDEAVGRIVGDMLVLRASAWAHDGRGHPMRFPIENYRHIGGANHFELLNHPLVYEQIYRWMTSRRALPPPSSE